MKISNDEIREIFVQNGFKLNSDGDLKEYVYKAAHALIALAQEVEPLLGQITILKQRVAEVEKDFSILEQNYDAAFGRVKELEQARKPKKLAFTVDEYGFYKISETPFGTYFIKGLVTKNYFFEFSDETSDCYYQTEQEAIAAAQADYDKRVGECFE